jgi:hypothetical protein
MLNNGSMVEIGTYEELKNLNGQFTQFIKTYLENQEKNSERMFINILGTVTDYYIF